MLRQVKEYGGIVNPDIKDFTTGKSAVASSNKFQFFKGVCGIYLKFSGSEAIHVLLGVTCC